MNHLSDPDFSDEASAAAVLLSGFTQTPMSMTSGHSGASSTNSITRTNTTTNKPTYLCHLCPYESDHSSHLSRHMRTHTGYKPHACPHCNYSCTQKSNLIRHIRDLHAGEKPFKCHMCHYKCTQKSHLVKHLKTKHLAFPSSHVQINSAQKRAILLRQNLLQKTREQQSTKTLRNLTKARNRMQRRLFAASRCQQTLFYQQERDRFTRNKDSGYFHLKSMWLLQRQKEGVRFRALPLKNIFQTQASFNRLPIHFKGAGRAIFSATNSC